MGGECLFQFCVLLVIFLFPFTYDKHVFDVEFSSSGSTILNFVSWSDLPMLSEYPIEGWSVSALHDDPLFPLGMKSVVYLRFTMTLFQSIISPSWRSRHSQCDMQRMRQEQPSNIKKISASRIWRWHQLFRLWGLGRWKQLLN